MEVTINNIIQDNLNKLIDFVLEKNPSADRIKINRKTKELQLRTIPKANQKVLDTIIDKKQVIKVKKSLFNNYILIVDENDFNFKDIKNNKFVIDMDNQTIIGIENLQGDIEPLTKALIEICHKYKLKYSIPLNMNINNDMDEDTTIVNEIHELGLNYAESESDNDNNED
jgi:hypothetical protein